MKMRQSNSIRISRPNTLIGKRRRQAIDVYFLAVNDSDGLSTRAFGAEEPVLLWLADNAEGPDNEERLKLRELARQQDKAPFWTFLRDVTAPYVQYRLQCHTFRIGGAR